MRRRVEWIDAVKGLGIILVIFAHANKTILTKYIYLFHMPLFFYISGKLFNIDNLNFRSFVKKKIDRLIIPCFAYGILIVLFNILNSTILYIKTKTFNYNIIDNLLRIFIFQNRTTTLWFLLVIFWLNILLFILLKA